MIFREERKENKKRKKKKETISISTHLIVSFKKRDFSNRDIIVIYTLLYIFNLKKKEKKELREKEREREREKKQYVSVCIIVETNYFPESNHTGP